MTDKDFDWLTASFKEAVRQDQRDMWQGSPKDYGNLHIDEDMQPSRECLLALNDVLDTITRDELCMWLVKLATYSHLHWAYMIAEIRANKNDNDDEGGEFVSA